MLHTFDNDCPRVQVSLHSKLVAPQELVVTIDDAVPGPIAPVPPDTITLRPGADAKKYYCVNGADFTGGRAVYAWLTSPESASIQIELKITESPRCSDPPNT